MEILSKEAMWVSFNPNNGDETINILVKNGHKAKAPSMAYNDDGLPFMEWRTSDDKAFDLGTPITSDMELTAAYYQKMTPEADFDVKCINWISSGFYWGVYNHLEALIDEKGLLKPVDTDKDSGEESSESGLYEGEDISEIEYVLSNMKNLSAIQHVLGTLFMAKGTNDEMTVEYSMVLRLSRSLQWILTVRRMPLLWIWIYSLTAMQISLLP